MTDYTRQQVESLFEYREGRLYRKISKANTKVGDEAGWMGNKGYRLVNIDYKTTLVHQVIFLMHYGYVPKYIDHINGIRTDNRIENLREATCSQNGCNQKRSVRNTSGCKNVSWNKSRKKWVVRIIYGNRKLKQWYVDDFEFAELLAAKAREKFHGEFACHV
jgi:hypothetical protein